MEKHRNNAGATPSFSTPSFSKFPKWLSQLERAVFVNITGALEKAGVDLSGLKLQQGGVRKDRLFFEKATAGNFEKSVRAGTKTNPKIFNKIGAIAGLFGGHEGMDDYMVRENVSVNSLQIGFGNDGVFADIDLWNPQKDFGKHYDEGDYNSGPPKRVTPHFYLAKVLGNCK